MSNPFVLAVMAAMRGKMPKPADRAADKETHAPSEEKVSEKTSAAVADLKDRSSS